MITAFFDLALDPMAIAGSDGYNKRVNPAYERTLGYPRRELLSRPFLEFVHPEDHRSVGDKFRELVDGDSDDVIGFEHRVICGDGSVRWFEWNTQTMPERGLIFGVARDVTDWRRADAELREAQRMVEASRDELAASRARIVAAADEERRRVVRDLHDGAQQRLVHIVLMLKEAQRTLEDEEDASAPLAEALEQAERANVELRELAHGTLPRVLAYGGLKAGVKALASRTPVPVDVDVSVDRLPGPVEATAYFVVAEALTNVAKHALAGHAEVTAWIEDGALAVHVRDDGTGGARPDGSGLLGLADRLATLDGQLRVESPTDGGTLIAAAIPIAARPDSCEARPALGRPRPGPCSGCTTAANGAAEGGSPKGAVGLVAPLGTNSTPADGSAHSGSRPRWRISSAVAGHLLSAESAHLRRSALDPIKVPNSACVSGIATVDGR